MTPRSTRIAVLFFLSCLVTPLHASDEGREKKERTLTVQGEGKASAIPDIAVLSVEVSQEGPELDPILTQARLAMAKILEAVKGQGIADKDIQTQYFHVQPKFEQDKRYNPHRVGYTVANRISIKVRDLKKTGKVLSAALGTGATSAYGPNFELDNPQAVERAALAAATQDAKAKAQAVADAAGVKLGDIIEIAPQNVAWPIRPMMARMAAMPMGGAASAEEPMQAGEQTLSGSVTLTYAIH